VSLNPCKFEQDVVCALPPVRRIFRKALLNHVIEHGRGNRD
jgi:hypothetical protein